jgi:cytoskeleton protein RodZ
MSDEQEKPAAEQEAEEQGPRAGERLAEARRERQISVLEVAKELHLDEDKVRALERNEFDTLGAPVFAKGHLRTYAELVGVDHDDILEDYYKMTRQEALPPVVVARRRVRQELSPGPWIAIIIVIIVAASGYWWFAVFSGQPLPVEPEQAPAQQQSIPAAVPESGETAAASSEALPEPAVDSPAPQPAAAEASQAEPAESAVAVDAATISLTFSGDCWTEISDATGRRLFFDMGRAGNSVELTGVTPFAVLFGNVDNVEVRINGNDYPVSSNNPGSRMARLTIVSP